MTRYEVVFTGMLVLRIVTATDMPTYHAEPQVHPGITQAGTLFAYI